MKRRLIVVPLVLVVVVTGIALTLLRSRPGRGSESAAEVPAGKYSESPILQERVERGELPPVEERLPKEPLVVTPREGIGRYDSDKTP